LGYRKLSVVTSSVRGRAGQREISVLSNRAVVDLPAATLPAIAKMNGVGRDDRPRLAYAASRCRGGGWAVLTGRHAAARHLERAVGVRHRRAADRYAIVSCVLAGVIAVLVADRLASVVSARTRS
jgi:hypothetical protein